MLHNTCDTCLLFFQRRETWIWMSVAIRKSQQNYVLSHFQEIWLKFMKSAETSTCQAFCWELLQPFLFIGSILNLKCWLITSWLFSRSFGHKFHRFLTKLLWVPIIQGSLLDWIIQGPLPTSNAPCSLLTSIAEIKQNLMSTNTQPLGWYDDPKILSQGPWRSRIYREFTRKTSGEMQDVGLKKSGKLDLPTFTFLASRRPKNQAAQPKNHTNAHVQNIR